MKMKQKDIAPLREIYAKRQGNVCPLCEEVIKEGDGVLDHDHKTGHVRATLHRECNAIEGKIFNFFRSVGSKVNAANLLRNLLSYQAADYSANPLHPKHRTDEDKEIRSLQRKIKAAKKPETIEKHKQAIKELRAKAQVFDIETEKTK